jgi:L-threonylcarbamoyladenylate synthase
MYSLGSIIEHLKSGELIAYPTEGVWGLGCDPNNLEAVKKILDLKERSSDKGLILLGSRFEQFNEYAFAEEYKAKLMTKWPGPHTWLVPAKQGVSTLLIGSNDKVALRLSNHEIVCELCEGFGGAIISTSANKEGLPTLTGEREIADVFPDVKILKGRLGDLKRPSTIQDVVTDFIVR